MRIELFSSDYLNIVELNTTGDNDNYLKGDSESKYVESEVFNIFANCFENANKLYEFFGATKYNARKIVPLRNELLQKSEALEKISSQPKISIEVTIELGDPSCNISLNCCSS